jgi:site-specific recombinase XerD
MEIRQQKTKSIENFPLAETAKNILYDKGKNVVHLPETEIFSLPNRGATNVNLKMWFKSAEISKNAHFHLSRHTFATLNISQGAHLYTVSKLLGHKRIATTEIYAKLVDDKKRETVNNLPIIEISK